MAKAKKKKNGTPHRGTSAHKKGAKRHGKAGNPHSKGHKSRKRAGNPSNFGGKAVGTLKAGVFALIGLVITRQLPQMVLGARNVGMIGYGANAITAFLGSWLIGKFAGTDAGNAALVGGGLYTVNRGIQEYLSPVGRILSLQGMGDYNALGEIVYDGRAYFPMPVAWDGNNPVIPNAITDAAGRAARAALPAPAAVMSGVGYQSRFSSRFAGR